MKFESNLNNSFLLISSFFLLYLYQKLNQMNRLLILLTLSVFVDSCKNSSDIENHTNKDTIADNKPFINPPLKNCQVPTEEYTVEAEKGDTVFTYSGAIIEFPSNAFIDENGNVVKGNVNISFRDFSDPVDFFLAGIPMEYDSAGVHYLFQSVAMCEINANLNGKKLSVNPDAKPTINMQSNLDTDKSNLYYLDTVAKQWKNMGKEKRIAMNNNYNKSTSSKKSASTLQQEETNIEQHVKPNKVQNPDRVIELEIEPGDFPELSAYSNVKFEIDPADKSFKSSDGNVTWNSVDINKDTKVGFYRINFKNKTRSVSYLARPVMEGADYEKALKIFTQKKAEYEEKKEKRLNVEDLALKEKKKKFDEEQAKFEAKNADIRRMNVLIEARNKETAKQNKKTELQNKEKEEQRHVYEIVNLIDTKQNITENYTEKEIELSNIYIRKRTIRDRSDFVIRSFQISNFGIHNVDGLISAFSADSTNYKSVKKTHSKIKFVLRNKKGESIAIHNLTIMFKKLNSIMRPPLQIDDIRAEQIITLSYIPDDIKTVCGISGDKCVYMTYAEFKAALDEAAKGIIRVIKEDRLDSARKLGINTTVDLSAPSTSDLRRFTVKENRINSGAKLRKLLGE